MLHLTKKCFIFNETVFTLSCSYCSPENNNSKQYGPNKSIFTLVCSGGAFYTPETIDTARLHYRSSWAPVLHAVALWLSSTGFGACEEKDEAPSALSKASGIPLGVSTTTKTFEESLKDRMHLMLGKDTCSTSEYLCITFLKGRVNCILYSLVISLMYHGF